MRVSVSVPVEFQGPVVAGINKRKGTVMDTDSREDFVNISADIPLNQMFGYSTDLRSITQGKGEFSMEYKNHMPVFPSVQEEIIAEHEKRRSGEKKN